MVTNESLQRMTALALAVFLLAGCGGAPTEPMLEATSIPPTATPIPSTTTPIPATATAQPTATPTQMMPTATITPLPDSRLDVTVTKDLVYAKGIQPEEQREWKLDEYAPTEPGDWPVVVFLHGAGGTKERWTTVTRAIAEQGAIVFAIDYPWIHPQLAIRGNGKGYREMADIVACAIRFARARASDLGMDTAPVVITGFCGGGAVASHVALAGESVGRRWEQYAASRGGPPRQVDCEVSQGSTHVDALVGIAGPYDGLVGYDGKYGREFMQEKDPDLWKLLHGCIGENPDLKVRLLHGETDRLVGYKNSVRFEATLAEAGYDVKLIQFTGGHELPLELTVQTVMNVARD